jgi:hypothetical protein
MPPKKAAKKSAGAGEAEEDLSVHNFYKFYVRNCRGLDPTIPCPVNKRLKEMYEINYAED